MTEAEWLTCDDPARMLEFCRHPAHSGITGQPYISDRRLRLFACACVRAVDGGQRCPDCNGAKGETVDSGGT